MSVLKNFGIECSSWKYGVDGILDRQSFFSRYRSQQQLYHHESASSSHRYDNYRRHDNSGSNYERERSPRRDRSPRREGVYERKLDVLCFSSLYLHPLERGSSRPLFLHDDLTPTYSSVHVINVQELYRVLFASWKPLTIDKMADDLGVKEDP